MIIESQKPERAALAVRRAQSSIIVGEESVLGPKAGFHVVMEPSEESNLRFARIAEQMADTEAETLLTDGAQVANSRARRFPNSPEAWVQAGFASLASRNNGEAIDAFQTA